MKKILFLSSIIATILACNTSTSTNTSTETSTTTTEAPASAAETSQAAPAKPASPEAEKGLALVAQSDCFTCHKVVETSVGPSYEAIAAKYPDTKDNTISLAQKIIKGGAGNWGSVPMTPHNDLSPDDAQLMVTYILSLK